MFFTPVSPKNLPQNFVLFSMEFSAGDFFISIYPLWLGLAHGKVDETAVGGGVEADVEDSLPVVDQLLDLFFVDHLGDEPSGNQFIIVTELLYLRISFKNFYKFTGKLKMVENKNREISGEELIRAGSREQIMEEAKRIIQEVKLNKLAFGQ